MSENKSSCISLQFIEKESKTVVKTINMKDDNPYLQKGFEPIRNSEKSDVYIPISFLKDYPLRTDLLQFYEDIAVNGKIEGRSNAQAFYSKDKKYIGINYGFGMLGPDAEYEPSFSTTYVNIYNSRGELENEVEFKGRGCGSLLLSEGATFLGFKFRLSYDIYKDTFQTGFAVYDFKQNKLVVEDFVPKGFSGSNPVIHQNQMNYRFHNSTKYLYIVYDFNVGKTYKKSLDRKEFKLFDKTREGIYVRKMGLYDSKAKFLSFEKDFDVIEW